MKNSNILILLALSSLILSFCKPSKKVAKSNANIAQYKKDSIEVSNLLKNKKSTSSISKNKMIQNSSSIVTEEELNSAMPNEAVKKAFKSNYPLVTEVSWTKEVPLIKEENLKSRDFKAFFLLNDNKNWALYSENGSLIETRVQILPEQLPPNVIKAIQDKYPDSYILSSSTFKNSKMQGSYAALIKVKFYNEAIEVILTENGSFVK